MRGGGPGRTGVGRVSAGRGEGGSIFSFGAEIPTHE